MPVEDAPAIPVKFVAEPPRVDLPPIAGKAQQKVAEFLSDICRRERGGRFICDLPNLCRREPRLKTKVLAPMREQLAQLISLGVLLLRRCHTVDWIGLAKPDQQRA